MSFVATAVIGSAIIGGVAANKAASKSASAANNATAAQSAAASESADVAREQLGLAREESTAARARQAQFDPKFMQILDQQMASQATQDQRSAQQWDNYTSTFMPLEQKLASDAIGYNTAGRRNAAAAEAVAGVDAQLARSRQGLERDVRRAGGSISAGRGLTLDAAQRFAGAKMAAGADRTARNQIETQGMSLVDNAAKFGRNMTSTGLQAASLAQNAGNSASNTLGQQQGAYNASMAPAAGLYGAGQAGLGQSAGIYGNVANHFTQQQQIANSGMAGLGGLAGTLLSSGQDSIFGQLIKRGP